jgi:serine phosphatase RsbU (regulator of sigma subunit)
MSFRVTIGKKIGFGFGILIFLTLIIFVTTYIRLAESRTLNDKINNIYSPTNASLQELRFMILESTSLIAKWPSEPKEDEPFKLRLNQIMDTAYPELKVRLDGMFGEQFGSEKDSIKVIFEDIQLLFNSYQELKDIFYSFESYGDLQNDFLAGYMLAEGGDIDFQSKKLLNELDHLILLQRKQLKSQIDFMTESFEDLQNLVKYLGLSLILGGILIAIYTTRSIVKPIQNLREVLVRLGKGVFPRKKINEGNDEIGDMIRAMNNVVDGLKRTKDFANEIGTGNFGSVYTPLSNSDQLGHALLKMREDLAENERMLEEKVRLRTAEVVQQKEEIEEQKHKIEEYYTQVTDSINYAKRIQDAILPPERLTTELLPDSFILFKPKDIVSGDFYWMERSKEKVFFAAVDCTGHGVPGAFMSIVGHNNLKSALQRTNGESPALVLDELNKGVSETLHQKEEGSSSKDGMDIACCALNYETLELEYAGAFNPLYILRDGEIEQIKANKFPIGSFLPGKEESFTNNKIKLKSGDLLYVFSDGYADQFGGPKGKKMMYKRFRELLISVSTLPMGEQCEKLDSFLHSWMGHEEQVDDIIVIGVRV